MSFADLYRPDEGHFDFDHQTVRAQLRSGPGSEGVAARACVAAQLVATLETMDHKLRRALDDSAGAWQGRGAALSDEATPVSNAVQALRELSAEIDHQVSTQIEQLTEVRTMPASHEVEPMVLDEKGTPPGFLTAQPDKELQERGATEAEETARRMYAVYRETTSSSERTAIAPPVPGPGR